MGIIRFLLATSVIAAHAGGILGMTFVGGKIAVQTFFIISGFYMALILDKKYVGRNAHKAFLINRVLRIYPAYFFILFISICFYIYTNTGPVLFYQQYFPTFDIFLRIYVFLSQITIIGLDWTMYMGVTAFGHPYFTTDYLQTTPKLFDFLFIPQAWTLSFELLFYLFIPFIHKKPWTCVALIMISILLRVYLYMLGLHAEPWTNRFFPIELPFFLVGVLIYTYQNSFWYQILSPKNTKVFFAIVVLYLCIYKKIPYLSFILDIKQAIFYSFIIIGLPGFFALFKQSRIDHIIGELSYPMYISHILVFGLVLLLPIQAYMQGLWTLILTILLSYVIYHYIDLPIDRYRQLLVPKKRKKR